VKRHLLVGLIAPVMVSCLSPVLLGMAMRLGKQHRAR
jgi:hypothetical protein